MTTDDQRAALAELRRLLAQATPGPWRKTKNRLAHVVTDAEGYRCRVATAGGPIEHDTHADSIARWNADAALIAAAITALPWLLAAAERELERRTDAEAED